LVEGVYGSLELGEVVSGVLFEEGIERVTPIAATLVDRVIRWQLLH
jgi:hypothetical protein